MQDLTLEEAGKIKTYIVELKNDKGFVEYLEGVNRGLINLVELHSFLTKNPLDYVCKQWGSMNIRRYNKVIEFVNSYIEMISDPETTMDRIKQEYPDLINNIDTCTYQLYDKALKYKLEYEDIVKHLQYITDDNRDSCFNLHNVTTSWEPYEILKMYYNTNDITIDNIKQCFYWNATLQKIQTINYNNTDMDREIQTINGEYSDIITNLDIYHNAYMSYNRPKTGTYGLKLLIVESLKGDPMDNIINYIKSNGIVPLTTIRSLYRDGVHFDIRDLNERCKDITYNNKDIANIMSLEIGDLIRCSLKGARNSITTCYMIFDGKLPNTLRIPKTAIQLQKYM